MSAEIILIGVQEPHRTGLLEWASERRLSTLELAAPDDLGAASQVEPALCVLGVTGEPEAAPERLRLLRKTLGGCPIVVLATDIGIDSTMALVRMGVDDVIGASGRLTHDLSRVTRHVRREPSADALAGSSPAVRKLKREISAAAPLGSTILLTGEHGVGKTAVAQAIHQRSRWKDARFVSVDCDALTGESLECELSAAERRTILLDEISDLAPAVQARLVRKLGAAEGTASSANRIIAASSRDLRGEVNAGRFRGDLYLRLNVLRVNVPPLRERLADLPELVSLIVDRVAREVGAQPPLLSDAIFEAMRRHSWPGNIRELVNVVERGLIRYVGGALDEQQLATALAPTAGAEAPKPGSDLSRATIASVLTATGGNVSRAARRLGVPRTTLTYRIRVLGLDDRVPRD